LPAAVPLLVRLTDRNAHGVVQTNPLGELCAQSRVRRQERNHLLLPRHRKRRKSLDALHPGAVRAHPPQYERDHLGSVHIENLESVTFHADVVAKPARLFSRIRMAVRVYQQPEVIGRLPVAVVCSDEVRQPQRDHRLTHAMLHRLPETQVSGIGQGRHQLRDPDAAYLWANGHTRSLRSRPSLLGRPAAMR
jgi:hypothetical protein